MVRKNIRTVYYRRKREGKTDYHKRLRLLTSERLRLVVRLTSNNVITQVVEYGQTGDKILVSAESKELQKHGWKYSKANTSAAYLTGLLLGKKAKIAGLNNLILDTGIRSVFSGVKLYAVLKGVSDAEIEIPYDEAIIPSKERLSGKHVADYANKLKGDKEKYQKAFSRYIKNNVNPEDMEAEFEKTKSEILK